MPAKSLPLIAAIFALGLGAFAVAQETPPVDPAIAGMSVDQLVKAREDIMVQNGRLLRNAGRFSGDEAVAAANTLLQNFINLKAMFPEGSLNAQSKALPVVWERHEEFQAIFDGDVTAAAAMLAAAQSGDAAAYSAAVRHIGDSCNACHDTFRMPR